MVSMKKNWKKNKTTKQTNKKRNYGTLGFASVLLRFCLGYASLLKELIILWKFLNLRDWIPRRPGGRSGGTYQWEWRVSRAEGNLPNWWLGWIAG